MVPTSAPHDRVAWHFIPSVKLGCQRIAGNNTRSIHGIHIHENSSCLDFSSFNVHFLFHQLGRSSARRIVARLLFTIVETSVAQRTRHFGKLVRCSHGCDIVLVDKFLVYFVCFSICKIETGRGNAFLVTKPSGHDRLTVDQRKVESGVAIHNTAIFHDCFNLFQRLFQRTHQTNCTERFRLFKGRSFSILFEKSENHGKDDFAISCPMNRFECMIRDETHELTLHLGKLPKTSIVTKQEPSSLEWMAVLVADSSPTWSCSNMSHDATTCSSHAQFAEICIVPSRECITKDSRRCSTLLFAIERSNSAARSIIVGFPLYYRWVCMVPVWNDDKSKWVSESASNNQNEQLRWTPPCSHHPSPKPSPFMTALFDSS